MNYEERLITLTLSDDRFLILTAENRAAIRNCPALFKDRFIDTGITEQALIGVATGLALRGRIPIVHALAAFLTMRAYEFIRSDIGFANLPVKLVGGVPGFLSEGNGPTHQALEDIAMMRMIPNMTVFSPADEEDMVLGLQDILRHPSPSYIRHNPLPPEIGHCPFQWGQAEIFSEGRDVTLIVHGTLFGQSLMVKEHLEKKGISVGLINLRMLKPIDEATLLRTGRESTLLVTIEDHFITGGLFSIVAELLIKHHQSCKVLPLALEERWFHPCRMKDLLFHEKRTGEQMARVIIDKMEES